MTGAVGTEGRVIRPARVVCRVAVGAGIVERVVMQVDPVLVEVRIWLRAAADLNICNKIGRSGDDRDRVT